MNTKIDKLASEMKSSDKVIVNILWVVSDVVIEDLKVGFKGTAEEIASIKPILATVSFHLQKNGTHNHQRNV